MKLRAFLPPLAALALSCKGSSSATDATPGDDDGGGTVDGPPGSHPDADYSCDPVAGEPALGLVEVATGFDMPVFVTSPPGDPRLFVLEKSGAIRIIDNGVVLPDPFLEVATPNITDLSDERGLLGLAFHPDYATNRKLYVFYTDTGSDTVVEQYLAEAANPNLADESSAQQVFFLDDFAGNHNGGMIGFGPDGYLYFGIGDGGGSNDPNENGQDVDAYFGKLLRVDVSNLPYSSPATNPFVGGPGLDEIWSYGLRNPWRWSFDRETGDLYIGDVGQNRVEEIDVAPAATAGRNYGWDNREGTECFSDSTTGNNVPSDCSAPYTQPVYDYTHGDGCTVIGGYVYRGCRMPGHHGRYFFADYCGGWVRSFRWDGGAGFDAELEHPDLGGADIVSFGQDFQGELYIVRQDTGQVMKIVPQ